MLASTTRIPGSPLFNLKPCHGNNSSCQLVSSSEIFDRERSLYADEPRLQKLRQRKSFLLHFDRLFAKGQTCWMRSRSVEEGMSYDEIVHQIKNSSAFAARKTFSAFLSLSLHPPGICNLGRVPSIVWRCACAARVDLGWEVDGDEMSLAKRERPRKMP